MKLSSSSVNGLRVRGVVLGVCAATFLSGCGRTVVMVRDSDQTAYAGRALGGYRYPHVVEADGKEMVLRSYGSPQRLPTRVSDVRTGEVVTAQTVGAYVDPANRNLLHQPHVVYRLDQSSRFRLAPAADAPLRTGPVAGLRRREYSPVASEGEAGREIMASRRAMERTATTIERVESQQTEVANETRSNNRELLYNQTRLLKLTQDQGKRIDSVEARQNQTQATPGGARYTLGTTPTVGNGSDGRQNNPPITAQQPVGKTPANGNVPRSGMLEN